MSRAVDTDAETAGYDDPVVRHSGSVNKTMHAVDRDAAQPQPACESAGREDAEWIVSERAALEPVYSPCGNPACQSQLSGDAQ